MAKTRRAYSGNAASTTISSGISAVDTTITIAAATGWPSGAPFYVVLDPGTAAEEKILVTRSSTTLTVSGSRGADDTSASSHSAGAVIYPVFTAVDANEANLLASTLTTQGDMLYHGASDFARVAIGTAGQVLKVNSGATAPEWGQIATAGIADSAVTSAKIADGTIVAGDIADGAITSAKILDGTIATGDLADGAVTSAKIADGTIVAGDIADGAVTSAKILDGTIVNADINASAAVDLSKLATGALPTGITVASANIVNSTIVDADISGTANIALSKLATGALPTGITVNAANIVNGSIADADISSSAAISLTKLSTGSIKYKLTSAQTIQTNTETEINFDSIDGNVDTTTYAVGINGAPDSIMVSKAGMYLFICGINFVADATGVRGLRIYNSYYGEMVGEATQAGFTGRDNVLTCSAVTYLPENGEVWAIAFQNSGGPLNIKADSTTFLSATYLGPA